MRSGFTLVEFLVFLGIIATLGSAVVTLLVWTQDARLYQRTAADVEQNGIRLLTTMTRIARRAELVLDPPPGGTGVLLNLQMAGTTEFPTIFAVNASGTLVMAQRDTIAPLTSETLSVRDLHFATTSSGSAKGITMSFRLEAVVPTPAAPVYGKEFRAAVTLYPDDLSEAGGCGSCTMTGCVNDAYFWSYCLYETCTGASAELVCR